MRAGYLHDQLRTFTRLRGVRLCGCVPITRGGEVQQVNLDRVRKPDGQMVGAFRGLMACGSPHSCPRCARRIGEGKARELAATVEGHRAEGGGDAFFTLTAPHFRGDGADAELRFRRAWRAFRAGRPWRDLVARWSVVGVAVSPDSTFGLHGRHRHAHGVVLFGRPLSEDELSTFNAEWFGLWRSGCERTGAGRPLARFTRVEQLSDPGAAGSYLLKSMREVARRDTKRGRVGAPGRSPWQVLESYVTTGDLADLALWHEHEALTRGVPCVSYSKGFRAVMARHAVRERAEAELAEARVDGAVIETLTLSRDDVSVLRRGPGRFAIARIRMRDGGAVAVLEALLIWREWDEARGLCAARDGPYRKRVLAVP